MFHDAHVDKPASVSRNKNHVETREIYRVIDEKVRKHALNSQEEVNTYIGKSVCFQLKKGVSKKSKLLKELIMKWDTFDKDVENADTKCNTGGISVTKASSGKHVYITFMKKTPSVYKKISKNDYIALMKRYTSSDKLINGLWKVISKDEDERKYLTSIKDMFEEEDFYIHVVGKSQDIHF